MLEKNPNSKAAKNVIANSPEGKAKQEKNKGVENIYINTKTRNTVRLLSGDERAKALSKLDSKTKAKFDLSTRAGRIAKQRAENLEKYKRAMEEQKNPKTFTQKYLGFSY